jgi:ABC-type nitrate/sulfonate/bicarbonate transport system substrate-binding protein
MRRRWIVLAGATLAALLGPAAAEPVKIRADWNIIPGQFAPLIPTVPQYAPGVYRHYGTSYVVEPLHMQGGGATLTALAVGDTDLSTLSPQTLVLGVTNAKLDLRVIGLQIATEVPGYLQTYFWVHKAEVTKIDDLKGRVIGITTRGSNVSSAAEMVMANHGFHEPRDFRLLERRSRASFRRSRRTRSTPPCWCRRSICKRRRIPTSSRSSASATPSDRWRR